MEEVKPKKYGKYDEWEIESLAESMMEVEKCKDDKEKMGYVQKVLKDKMKDKKMEVKSIADLLKIGEMKRMEEDEES